MARLLGAQFWEALWVYPSSVPWSMSEVRHECAVDGDLSARLFEWTESRDNFSVLTSSNLSFLLSDSSPNVLMPLISSLLYSISLWYPHKISLKISHLQIYVCIYVYPQIYYTTHVYVYTYKTTCMWMCICKYTFHTSTAHTHIFPISPCIQVNIQ